MFSQSNDAQLWENINFEYNINQKWVARINQESRITDNFTRPSFNYFDVGLNYKINKHIHATLAYVWVEKRKPTDIWSARHQAYFYLTFRKKFNGLLITNRQMVLWQVKDYYSSQDGHIPDYYLRNKTTIRWDKSFRFQPYVATEIYYQTYGPDKVWQQHFNRVRYFAGVFYHPNAVDEFETYYLIEHHFNSNTPPTNWVIGVGYAHTF